LEYRNADICVNSADDPGISRENLEFTRLNCLQEASISIRVSLAAFVRGSIAKHCGDQYSVLFHYYSVGGKTTMPRGLHARLCHAFLG